MAKNLCYRPQPFVNKTERIEFLLSCMISIRVGCLLNMQEERENKKETYYLIGNNIYLDRLPHRIIFSCANLSVVRHPKRHPTQIQVRMTLPTRPQRTKSGTFARHTKPTHKSQPCKRA